jgi:hypothetical protein
VTTKKTRKPRTHTIDLHDLRAEQGGAGRYGAFETTYHEFSTAGERDAFMAQRRRRPCREAVPLLESGAKGYGPFVGPEIAGRHAAQGRGAQASVNKAQSA